MGCMALPGEVPGGARGAAPGGGAVPVQPEEAARSVR